MREAQLERLKLLEELQKRQNTAISRYVPDDDPDRDQLSFHKSKSLYRCAFGGNQSGKSYVAAAETAMWARNCHRFQDISPGGKVIYVISANYLTIFQGIWRHLNPSGGEKDGCFLQKDWIKARGPIIAGARVPLPSYMDVYIDPAALSEADEEKRRNGQLKKKDWPTSRIMFISGEGVEQARKKIQGVALHLAVVDEEVEGIIDELKVRMLAYGGRLCISATLIQSQPWLIDLEDRFDSGDKSVHIVRLNTEKNPHLHASTREELIAEMSEEEREIRIYGKSRRKMGLVYPSFGLEHICDPFTIPDEWPRYCSHDAGYRVHAVLWAAVAPDQTIYLYRELYARERALADVCRVCSEMEGWQLVADGIGFKRSAKANSEVVTRLIDPAQLRNLEDGNVSVAIQMAAYFDMPVIPANNEVQAGIETVRRLLEVNPVTKKPHIQVFSELDNFNKEIRTHKLRRDRSKVDSHETKAEPLRRNNHLMDDLRYLCSHIVHGFGPRPEQRRRGYTAANATVGMAQRMEEQAAALRQIERGKGCHPIMGSEW